MKVITDFGEKYKEVIALFEEAYVLFAGVEPWHRKQASAF
jgi:hypothetical protein